MIRALILCLCLTACAKSSDDQGAFIVLAAVVGLLAAALLRKKGGVKALLPKSGWMIGPVINGRNYSVGMPERPTTQGPGWYFDFPVGATKKVDYVQNFSPPSLKGAREIVATFEVTGDGFAPYERPSAPPLVSLAFQRKGDDWSGNGKYVSYRWYSKMKLEIEAGVYTLRVPIEPSAWSNVYGKSGETDPSGFHAAIDNLESIAFVFGHASGAGHGVFTSTSGRFVMRSLNVNR